MYTLRVQTLEASRQGWERGRLSRWEISVVVLVYALWALAIEQPAQAAVFNILSGDVPALINAINTANDNGEDNTINLEAGTYSLTKVDNFCEGDNGLPAISSSITINGAGADSTVIARAVNAPKFRIFCVNFGSILTLNDLTITGGINALRAIAPGGGGIDNHGTVILNNSTLSNNTAEETSGGGIYCEIVATLRLSNSTVSGNKAGGEGGGILNFGKLTIINSTLSGNEAAGDGGGILNELGGSSTITNSTISANIAGGGRGGGIFLGLNNGGTADLTRNLIAGNTADSGAEVYHSGNDSFSATLNLFGHQGLTTTQALVDVPAGGGNIIATSDGNKPTALAAILDTTLRANGGLTLTHNLVAGSPAIDAAGGTCQLTTDQRGAPRPVDGNDDGDEACDIGAVEFTDLVLPPALVLGLRHNVNQEREDDSFIALFTARASAPVQRLDGGDLGAPLHRGYEWWMVHDAPERTPPLALPPGIVFGLKHSVNQAKAGITVFGHDPCTGPSSFPGFRQQLGGDLGAPSGQGFCWYESTEMRPVDWSLVDRLPRWTVVGLKHSINQRDKRLIWQGTVFDPADPSIPPPPGFERKAGGDLGAPAGQGYFWYEKVTGPELVVKPPVTIRLHRSLILPPPKMSHDRDCLDDAMENELANRVRPFLIFDSHEIARKDNEPVTLFQVRPLSTSPLRVRIKWVFLFRKDGGYGPSSDCSDSHQGDNDDAAFELESNDHGRTWTLIRANLSFKGIEWPTNSRSEWFDLSHPIIYMSASKHHEYFTRDYDERDSRYSDFGCNDNVNGRGAKMLADSSTLARSQGRRFNNVGEPESHPSPPYTDDLSPVYPGQSAWADTNFFEVGPNGAKWMNYSFVCPR